MKNVIIEISMDSAMACTLAGGSVVASQWADDFADCAASGDCQGACEYFLDQVGVEFIIVARDSFGRYENRLATDSELKECCEEIYFESESDFSDRRLAETYLVWEAANSENHEVKG